LSDWSSVWQLVEGLPLLERLSVASNHLGDIKSVNVNDDADDTLSKYPPRHVLLQHLNLHDVRIQSLATIFVLGRALPNLRELILAHNGVPLRLPTEDHLSSESLSSESCANMIPSYSPMALNDLVLELAETLPNLVYLDCSQCHGFQRSYSDESAVLAFDANEMVTAWSQLPQLQSLSLDDNVQLTTWATLDTDVTTVTYPVLEQLQVAGTGLSNWATISAWHETLPRLQRLRWGSCPLSNAASTAVGRRRLLYLLPRLTLLNGSVVTELERRDAARQYYQRPWTNVDKSNDDASGNDLFRVQDEYWAGVYPELVARASSLDSRRGQSPTSTVDGAPSHADFEVVNVTIRSFAASSCTLPPLIRRLPSHLTIGKLKALCARQFGLDIDLQELRFRRHESDAILEPMDGDDNTLHDYGVPDGASIVMMELDLAALALQEQRAAQSLEERTRQQERERDEFSERQKLASK
jgi:Ubiquitin-like domain